MVELDNTLLQSQLMDIYQPESVSWWPLAPGWWILLLLILAVLIIVTRYVYQKTELRRVSLIELQKIEKNYQQERNLNQLAMTLNLFLRRVLLSKTSLNFEPGMVGQQWLEYLDSQWQREEFKQGIGQKLVSLPYQKQTERNDADSLIAKELIALTRAWVRKVA